MQRLYPFDLPESVHPYAWTLLGLGLPPEVIQRACVQLFDQLGVRLTVVEPSEVALSWAVSWPLDPGERTPVTVGDRVDEVIPGGEVSAVRVSSGALPPGLVLEPHTGRLVGEFAESGLFAATFTVGPQIKWDPLGSDGGPHSPGRWIPVDDPRLTVAPVVEKKDPATLTDEELEEHLMSVLTERDARIITAAEEG